MGCYETKQQNQKNVASNKYTQNLNLENDTNEKISLQQEKKIKGQIFQNSTVKTILIQQLTSQDATIETINCHKKKKLFEDDEEQQIPLTSLSNIDGEKLQGPTSNIFFDSLFLAYSLHGNVVLSPDDIWLQICGQFSQYVNNNAEKLRDKIVTFEGKKVLIVLYNETNPEFQNMKSKSFRWDIIMDSFLQLIKGKTINGIGDLIECTFSTSQTLEKIASINTLMHACEKFFDYRIGRCGCGIQNIHFLGQRSDWELLIQKNQSLKKFSGDQQFIDWIEGVDKILKAFLSTYDGDSNVQFWNGIIQKFVGFEFEAGPSGRGGHYIQKDFLNGWILDLFLFNKQGEYLKENMNEVPTIEPQQLNSMKNLQQLIEIDPKSRIPGITLEQIPNYQVKAPVLIQKLYGPDAGKMEAVYFVSNFTAVIREQNNYRPQLTFSVVPRELNEKEKNLKSIFE